MRYLFAACLFSLVLSMSLRAEAQMVTDQPVCFTIYNTAPYTVLGTVETDYYTRSDGIRTRHRSNFRLGNGERNEFCTTGPFFPDWTLRLILRSLFPIFDCRTRVDMGEIVIHGEVSPDGSANTWADCYRSR